MYYGSYIMNVTEACNFRCIYCPVKYSPKHISFEMACKIVDYCLKQQDHPHISFFGGEPLLVYDEIIVPLICCYKDKVSWGISTNGSLLTPQRLKFLYDNHVKILFSIDGPKEI